MLLTINNIAKCDERLAFEGGVARSEFIDKSQS